MNDKEFAKQRRRIQALVRKWHWVCGMDGFNVTHVFERGIFKQGDGRYSENAIAATDVLWEYCLATITWNMSEVANISDETLEDAVVHEFMHVLLSEMREEGIKHEERTASVLSMAFLRTRNAKRPEPKKPALPQEPVSE